MKITVVTLIAVSVLLSSRVQAADFKLPPQITPSMRAACEKDVRRLCIGRNPTVNKVKSCVVRKFTQLGRRCQLELATLMARYR